MIRETLRRRLRELSVAVEDTRIRAVRRADLVERGLRLYSEGHIGVAGALGEGGHEELEAPARAALARGVSYPCEPGSARRERLEAASPLEDPEVLVDDVEWLLAGLHDEFPDLQFSHRVRFAEYEASLVNDRGLDLHARVPSLEVALAFKERHSGSLLDGAIELRPRRWDRQQALAAVLEVCEAYEVPEHLPAWEGIPVLFPATLQPMAGGPLGWFHHLLDGRSFALGGSLLSGRTGEEVFHPDLSLRVTHHPDDRPGPCFDDEGVVHAGYRAPLVEAGRLVAPFTDRRTAWRHGLPLTGAAAGRHDGVPTLQPPVLELAPGERPLHELLGAGPGIMVMLAVGGEASPDGEWSCPVQLALLHDGKRPLGRLPPLRLRGDLRRVFREGFVGVSSDRYPSFTLEHLVVLEMDAEPMLG